jgi:hypothetical protein
MARPKGSTNKKTTPQPVPRKPCSKCNKPRRIKDDFYMSLSPAHEGDQRVGVCKICVKEMTGEDYSNLEQIQNVLRILDKPYIHNLYQSAISECKDREIKDVFGIYIKSLWLNEKNSTWSDSVFSSTNNESKEVKKSPQEATATPSISKQKQNDTGYDIEELKEKYGYGYPDDEYILFERKYQQLRTSFQLLTTMHEEYFREYCINKVKETLAKAKGNFKEAKEWAAMVKDVAEAGKLKPSQMSKADLSSGLDGFGQLARMVEENYEIQPILPKFIEQPKDKVDVVLWCFVNYVRDIKGLPECDYKEIYDFYERRRAEYESQVVDNKLNKIEEVDQDDEL